MRGGVVVGLIDHPGAAATKRLELAHLPEFNLGDARIRPARREIQLADRTQVIEPRTMQVLVVLGRADGEVVSRSDLIEQCWDGRIVTDDAVTRVLSQLRRLGAELCEGAFTIQTIRGVGCRLVVRNKDSADLTDSRRPIRRVVDLRERQRISFCRTDDGVTLAYARLGEGMPLVRAAHSLSHLELELENPAWRHWIDELSSRNMLLRYDSRGNGLSERKVEIPHFDRLVADLATVVDAAGLQRFDLLAISQGTPLAIAFAARYPQRVARMVLINSFASGWRHSHNPAQIESWEAMCRLIRTGWANNDIALQRVFINQGFPDATPEQRDSIADLQERSASAEYACGVLEMFGGVDVTDLLPDVRAETLVMHCNDDQLISSDRGRFVASRIPGAQFIALDGRNHVPQPQDASWPQMQHELRRFLS